MPIWTRPCRPGASLISGIPQRHACGPRAHKGANFCQTGKSGIDPVARFELGHRRTTGRPDLTAEVISPDGWFRTSDKASLDPQSFVTFIGREKDIIRRGSVTIIPADVENVLRVHPDIAEVAVVSVPDERLGERACACIVPREGAAIDRESVSAYLRGDSVWRALKLLEEEGRIKRVRTQIEIIENIKGACSSV
ncbi:AMP-binding enzyme [Rhizobiales bacterium GAS191]|nr:AMP-binding enzyme [Rhizobiales bacterium GAS191]